MPVVDRQLPAASMRAVGNPPEPDPGWRGGRTGAEASPLDSLRLRAGGFFEPSMGLSHSLVEEVALPCPLEVFLLYCDGPNELSAGDSLPLGKDASLPLPPERWPLNDGGSLNPSVAALLNPPRGGVFRETEAKVFSYSLCGCAALGR